MLGYESAFFRRREIFQSAVFYTAQQNSNKAMSLKLQRRADFQSAALFPRL